jgi:VanZ family protein
LKFRCRNLCGVAAAARIASDISLWLILACPGLARSIYEVQMFDKVTTIAAWALLALIAFATISPIQDRPTLATSPSIEHVAAFAVLGVLFCISYPRQFALVCLIVIGSAILLEFAQLLTPDRHGRVDDALKKIGGGAAGIVIGRAVFYLARKKRLGK